MNKIDCQQMVGFYTANDVLKMVPFSRPTLFRLVKNGKFPAPRSMGVKRCYWKIDDVDNWLNERMA